MSVLEGEVRRMIPADERHQYGLLESVEDVVGPDDSVAMIWTDVGLRSKLASLPVLSRFFPMEYESVAFDCDEAIAVGDHVTLEVSEALVDESVSRGEVLDREVVLYDVDNVLQVAPQSNPVLATRGALESRVRTAVRGAIRLAPLLIVAVIAYAIGEGVWEGEIPIEDLGIAVGVAIAIMIGFHVLYHPLVVAHERTHAIALERLGYGSEIEYRPSTVFGFQVPGYGGGTCWISPTMHADQMTDREILIVSLAPLSLTLLTSPIPIAIGILLETTALGVVLTFAIWTFFVGPSSGDWGIAMAVARYGNEEFHNQPRIGSDSPHVLAEGIEP